MQVLEKIFGGVAKVKMMRLFMFNPDTAFDVDDIVTRAQASHLEVRSEIANFLKMGFIKRKTFSREIPATPRTPWHRKKTSGWIFNEKFPHAAELRPLLTNTVPLKNGDIIRRINRVGKIKLIIVAGIFIQNTESRIDLLVVGDSIRKIALEDVMKKVEAEIGKELRYTAFETDDFKYRLSVYDKLIRDILDFEHHTVLDKLGSF